MIRVVRADGRAEGELLREMRSRAAETALEVNRAVSEILADVRVRGYEAVEEYSLKFDHAAPREIGPEEWEAACRACPESLRRAMERAAENIRAYNERLLHTSDEWQVKGGTVGRVVRGLDRVGIYVPGGTAAYPSSVLMNAVPARVAGVREIVMVTPPTENLSSAVLTAAKIAGVDRVIAVGGAQGIAALAYGAGFIPKADKIVGPGNAFVAAAKRLVYGTVDIDMVAGPSEILVIADESADPRYIAADLMSQAEHDRMASAILITTSEALCEGVQRELARQIETLPRREIIEASLRDFGACVLVSSLSEGAALANEAAPEHLEIVTRDPRALLPEIRNAGAVFLGAYSPEPLGDYMAGPDHVLPTSGTARFFSPLSAESFLKSMSVISYTREGLAGVSDAIVEFAESERLSAHANAIRVRFEGEKQ